jgi:predicted porin
VASADDAARFALGYVHNLSKRTALYGTVSRLTNHGASRLASPGGSATTIAGGASSKGAEFGLRHSF